MSLTEIETVVDQLSVPEQEELVRHLEMNLLRERATISPVSAEKWMKELDSLRASISTGTVNISSEQILDELRED